MQAIPDVFTSRELITTGFNILVIIISAKIHQQISDLKSHIYEKFMTKADFNLLMKKEKDRT